MCLDLPYAGSFISNRLPEVPIPIAHSPPLHTNTHTYAKKRHERRMQRKHNFGLLWCNCAYVLFLGIMGDAVVTILSDNCGYRGYNAPCRFARRVSTLKCASVLRTKG